MNHLGDYDVIVIGAGHAGIEAAHAAAMLGAKTAVFTMSLDAIGNMPCNPSIGGTAKGTLVRELDALGGVMGLAADATYLQSRMLNKGKGPAVHALRVQTDRKRYHEYMKHALELTPGLAIHQAEIISIEVEDGHVKGVVHPAERGVWRKVRGHRHRHQPRRKNFCGRCMVRLRPRRDARGQRPHREPEGRRSAAAPLQDRHACPGASAEHRLRQTGMPARRPGQ